MVKAQDWLNTNYPKNQRHDIKLDLSNKNLEGELDLTDFTNLRILKVDNQYPRNWQGFYDWLNDNIVDINEKGPGKGNLKANKRSEYPGLMTHQCGFISVLMTGIEFHLGKTQLDYGGLKNQWPLLPYDDSKTFFQLAGGQGNRLTFGMSFSLPHDQPILNDYEKLLRTWRNSTVTNNKLTALNVSDLTQLTTLNCANNQIKTLNINGCPNLEEIIANHNNLTGLEVKDLTPAKLKTLDLHNNQLTTRDLSALTPLVNLETLDLGKDNQVEQINRGLYNQFTGSLQALANYTKLKKLNISATDINHGLEYLPESLEEFYCDAYGTITEVKAIEKSLATHGTFAVNDNQLKAVKKWKKANANLVTSPTVPITTPKPTDSDKPISTLPISEQKPVVSIPDNTQVGLPANAPEEWRDKLAEHPFLKKRITELEQQLQQQRNDFDKTIKEADGEIAIQKDEIGNLQMDKSQLKAERDDWKRKAAVANEWITAFPLKNAAMLQAELASKVTLTASQQEAIDKYPQLKTDLENWTKAFADFANPEKARTAYEQAIKNQVTADHDKNSEDLREYQTAFPNYPGSDFFGKKPQDIRNLYDNLKKNQTPTDYQSIKDKLDAWINIFTNDPDLQGKEPAKVKEYLENLRTNFQQQSNDLLSEYRKGIRRRVDNIISKLEKIEKNSLEAKYSGAMYDIYPKLTLDNWAASEKNLKITLAICATEKATAWAKQVEKLPTGAERTTQTKDLGAFVAKVERNWLQTQISADKNALFYLTILEDQDTYRQQSGQLKVQFPEIARRDWNTTTTSQFTTQDGYEYQSTTTSYTAVIEQGKQ